MNGEYQNEYNDFQSNDENTQYTQYRANNMEAPMTGWSWGAAMLGIPWGIGNNAYLVLLGLLPILNLFWWIVCGIKGREWAWLSGRFNTVAEFEAAQATWDKAGKIMFIIVMIWCALWVLIMIIAGASVFSILSALE